MPATITVGAPLITGPPTCGTGGVPGVAIGQVCMSVMRAAGGKEKAPELISFTIAA
jgi:hypothetical protein